MVKAASTKLQSQHRKRMKNDPNFLETVFFCEQCVRFHPALCHSTVFVGTYSDKKGLKICN